jgi:hypothetical protein
MDPTRMTRPRFRRILLASLALLPAGSSFACVSAPSLGGSPQTTGIVVVEPDITFYANTIGTPYGERLISGAMARADDANQVVSGLPTSGLVVFSDLAPGRWRLTLIEGQLPAGIMLQEDQMRWRRHYEVPPESADAFTFEVRAGEVVYAGAGIVDDDRADSRGVRWKRHDDPAAEQQAWKRMVELYGTSSWGPVLHARLGASAAPAAKGP